MKKIIAKMLIIILLITFIIPKFTFATEAGTDAGNENNGYNTYKNLAENGTANVNGRNEPVRETFSGGDAIAVLLAITSSAIAEAVRGLLKICVLEGDTNQGGNFTIASLVSGEYSILNNDFLLSEGGKSDTNDTIKSQVGAWYYGIRTLAIILSLFMLIYIGIRMAISTLADDKAKYKKMLVGWIQSFILIFFLHYIMIIAMIIQKALINILPTVNGNTENIILGDCLITIAQANGWNILWAAILYWVLTYYQVKFFFLYAKRMISTAFLMVIAPLITVTYSVDKVADNKAQAFNAWLKEFLVNIFIQPVHLIIYLIFIVSASEIATKLPLFTLIFFGALSRGEKIIKGLFGMRGMKSINSIGRRKK